MNCAERAKEGLRSLENLVDLVKDRPDRKDGIFPARAAVERAAKGLESLFGVPVFKIVNNDGKPIG